MEDFKNQMFATHAVAAAASVTLGTAVTYPLDTIKTIVQVGSGSSKRLTPKEVVERVRAFSGYSGLYSGIGWLSLGRTLGLGARFGIYEILAAFSKDGRGQDENFLYFSEAFLIGAAAGAAESLVSTPFEIIKLRHQVTAASRVASVTSTTDRKAVVPIIEKLLRGYSPDKKILSEYVVLLSVLNPKHPDMASALQSYPWMMTGSGRPPSVCDVKRPLDIVSLEGWRALWKGLRPGLFRDSVFAGIFFSSWEIIRDLMLFSKGAKMTPLPRSYEEISALPLSPLSVSIAAALSGVLAAAASHCFDTAKSRAQCTVMPKHIIIERRFFKWKKPGKWFERTTGIHPSDRKLLFRGIASRVARSGIASFLIVGSYFLAIDHLVTS